MFAFAFFSFFFRFRLFFPDSTLLGIDPRFHTAWRVRDSTLLGIDARCFVIFPGESRQRALKKHAPDEKYERFDIELYLETLTSTRPVRMPARKKRKTRQLKKKSKAAKKKARTRLPMTQRLIPILDCIRLSMRLYPIVDVRLSRFQLLLPISFICDARVGILDYRNMR